MYYQIIKELTGVVFLIDTTYSYSKSYSIFFMFTFCLLFDHQPLLLFVIWCNNHYKINTTSFIKCISINTIIVIHYHTLLHWDEDDDHANFFAIPYFYCTSSSFVKAHQILEKSSSFFFNFCIVFLSFYYITYISTNNTYTQYQNQCSR